MRISLVVAVAENGVIGRDNALPWRLSSDLKRFKAITMGKPIIMGRKTYESIGKPLPGRTNIVLTRDTGFHPEGVEVVHDMASAVAVAEAAARDGGVSEIMVIGGVGIYELALPEADRIYLTEVHASPEGDAMFPPLDAGDWLEASREYHPAQPGETSACSFVVLDRKSR